MSNIDNLINNNNSLSILYITYIFSVVNNKRKHNIHLKRPTFKLGLDDMNMLLLFICYVKVKKYCKNTKGDGNSVVI